MIKRIAELEELAMDGDFAAAKELVRIYREGDGAEVDDDKVLFWTNYCGDEKIIEEDSSGSETEDHVEDGTVFHDNTDETTDEQAEHIENEQTKSGAVQQSYSNDETYKLADLYKLPTFKLKTMADEGSLLAQVARGIKYIKSANDSEAVEGEHLIRDLIGVLKAKFAEGKNEEYRTALSHALVALGEYYEKHWRDGQIEDSGNNAFLAYSNALEIDSTASIHLARCYREGIGCERNQLRALELSERTGLNGGARDRFEVAEAYLISNQKMKGVEWLQLTLDADDIVDNKSIQAIARLRLALLNELDENGSVINLEDAKNAVIKRVEEGEPMAISHFCQAYGVGAIRNINDYYSVLDQAINQREKKYSGHCTSIRAALAKEDADRNERERIEVEQKRIAEENAAKEEEEKKRAIALAKAKERALNIKKNLLPTYIMLVGIAVALSIGGAILHIWGDISIIKNILIVMWIAIIAFITVKRVSMSSQTADSYFSDLDDEHEVGIKTILHSFAIETLVVLVVLIIVLIIA